MSSSKSAAQKNRKGKASPRQGRAREVAVPQREPLLSAAMRDDLIGIALAVIGIVLFVAVVMPGDAVASSGISWGLRHAFGLGAYIVPFAFVLWGGTYFLKTEETKAWRIIIGIGVILVAVMGLLSLFQPGVDPEDPSTLLAQNVLVAGGGYVGSGLSWLLMGLFGQVIACIVFIALIVCGLVLVGVSVSVPLLFIKNFIFQKPEDAQDEGFDEARVSSGRTSRMPALDSDGNVVVDDASFRSDPEETVELDSARGKRGARTKRRRKKAKPVSFASDDRDASQETLDLAGLADADGSDDDAQGLAATVPLAGAAAAAATKKLSGARKRGATVTKPAKKRQATATRTPVGTMPTAMDGFVLPDPRVLHVSGPRKNVRGGELKQTAALLQQTLEEFNLPAKVVGWLAGPTVTMYKVELARGVKLSRLTNLSDDIALSLAASAVRIAQIPNTSLVGVEIPNRHRENVLLGDVIPAAGKGPLELAIGEDVDGDKICVDLAKMPHLLIGGTTGSGKSITLNSMIMTILMRATPAEVRMILIDPKRVEFSLYNGIPHLFVPPVTEPKEAASALKWGVAEMERRLKVFESVGARNIGLYNEMIQKGELTDDNGDHPAELPYIVIVIDELSDLMMVAGKDVEDSIVRISQLARAAGIHLIVATQRPSANVVTGMIKANITNRIAMTVATAVESRVILDQSGAEKLVGNGDMLFAKPEWGKPKRIQGCYVGEDEIQSVVAHLKEQGEPEYNLDILHQSVGTGSGGGGHAASSGGGFGDDDPLLWDAAEAVVTAGIGSTSMLQRRLKVGYSRAGRIMDELEEKGVVGPGNGSKPREVIVEDLNELESLRALDEQDEDDEKGF